MIAVLEYIVAMHSGLKDVCDTVVAVNYISEQCEIQYLSTKLNFNQKMPKKNVYKCSDLVHADYNPAAFLLDKLP